MPLPTFFVTHTLTEMRKALLPLPCLPTAVRPVAQLRKLPADLSFENDLKRIFERFSGSFCARPRLACENFVRHVDYSLVLLHGLPFSLAPRIMPSDKAQRTFERTCA
jgi:hypothetical protein